MPLRYKTTVDKVESPCIPLAKSWGNNYVPTPDEPLLDFSQGVPADPPHPSYLAELAKVSATSEAAKYGPILGEDSLRSALATELSILYHTKLDPSDMAITAGCNMAFLSVLMTITSPHTSSVIIPLPAYFNHTMSLDLCHVKPEYIPCDPGDFSPSIEAARTILQQRTGDTGKPTPKAILLTTPNNPTGAIYDYKQLKAWLALAREYSIPLILDETYRDFMGWHSLFEDPNWRDSLISIGSFSKQYRIPGHRLGSITAAPELLEEVAKVLDCMQICPPRPPQLALAPLLPSLRKDVAYSAKELDQNLSYFAEQVESVYGWRVASYGGFYAYVEYPEEYTYSPKRLGVENVGSSDVSQALATQCGVLTLPGSFFVPTPVDGSHIQNDTIHQDRWIRFAVANVSYEALESIADRLGKMNDIMEV